AMRLTPARAPASGSARCSTLRTVRAGPTIVVPGIVGLSTDAPIAPDAMPSSSMASEVSPVGSPMARKRSTAPSGGRGVFNRRMRSGAIRPVRRFSMAAAAPMFLVMWFVLSVRLIVVGSVEPNTGVADHDPQAWVFHLSDDFALLEGRNPVARVPDPR